MLGEFTLLELDPPKGRARNKFTAIMTKAPVVIAGYGGWTKIARPRKKSLTEWIGRDPVSIRIEFILDTDAADLAGLEVERMCRALESMVGVESSDPEPPLCRLSSDPPALMPHGYHRAPHVEWFVETGPEWDVDQMTYNKVGNRVRAAGAMTVTQHVEDSRLQGLTAAQRRRQREAEAASRGGRGGRRKSYTVKRGDTLTKIAARKDVYGDAKKWERIAKANKIRDPKNLKVGQKLKIP